MIRQQQFDGDDPLHDPQLLISQEIDRNSENVVAKPRMQNHSLD
jgi:hypothetical protein